MAAYPAIQGSVDHSSKLRQNVARRANEALSANEAAGYKDRSNRHHGLRIIVGLAQFRLPCGLDPPLRSAAVLIRQESCRHQWLPKSVTSAS
jgi:hypothetical protein